MNSDVSTAELEGCGPSKLEAGLVCEIDSENVVDWNGADDPQNPLNWSSAKSFGHVMVVAGLSMVVNLEATMFAPGVLQVIEEFRITNATIATLTISIYLLGFAIGPLVVAPCSEIFGRLPVYHISNAVFLAFVIGGALSKSLPQFLVFRFISGCAGATPLTIGGGTIADVIPLERRGLAAALFGLGPLLGPVLGPAIGGFVAEYKGWRWTFWLMAIISGTTFLLTIVFMRETHPDILLKRKAAYLRHKTGNIHFVSKPESKQHVNPKRVLLNALVRPITLLLFSPIVTAMSLYVAFVFGLLYLLLATFSTVFAGVYHFNIGISGLAYMGLGVGELVGLLIFGLLTDKISKRKMLQHNITEPKPEHRLVMMMWFSPIIPVGFFIYGWTVYYKVHWIAPIIGTFFIGFGSFFVIMTSQLYLVDTFGSQSAASALGANILMRSLFGTFLPLAGPAMYTALNYGWGNSLLGFIALIFFPVPVLLYRYGEWLRSKTMVKL